MHLEIFYFLILFYSSMIKYDLIALVLIRPTNRILAASLETTSYSLLLTKRGLISVRDVQEAVGVLSLLVDFAHQGVALQEISTINEEVKRASLWKLNSLSNDVVEVVGRKVVWNEVPIRLKIDFVRSKTL